ncbi:MAG: topoisomerase C-terminal repeat-containing protein [Clostridia bacterium]|nr:topoisomerase C-terminal repeat-containing protein [Clostridia bacterium]
MILIIAEKPSLARTIAGAISQTTVKRNGYIEAGSCLVTWAFGHLFALADIEYYQGIDTSVSKPRWTMEKLPCFPKSFHYELRKGKDDAIERQFAVIRSLCQRPDVDTIVNAGDSDREGEIIVRLCIQHSFEGNIFRDGSKRLCRLWLPDQTPETIREALSAPREEKEFDNLAREGFARTFIDWLYGVNLTRFATLKSGRLLRVGRVIVPIVKAIYDRDMAIRNFVPEKYYAIASKEKTKGEVVELTSKLKFDKNSLADAEKVCAAYNAMGAVVADVKKKREKLSPGKLYSLTKLQNHLGKKYKMSMQQSLELVQGLYEKGFVTYPRTNSEYLATAEKDKVKGVLNAVAGVGYPVKFKDGKNIFDDSKIESHSALTPTTKIPDKTKLTPDEAKVYGAILRRFVAVFCAEECVADKTEIRIHVGNPENGNPPENGEAFVLKGTVIREPGWTKYDDYSGRDKVLPPLTKGDVVNIDFKPVEKETSPPKHYTIETLNNYLKNPFREELAKKPEEGEEEGSDEEDYRAIFEGLELGTEATRTQIIDNARESGYIQLKKDVYTILPEGEFLVESLSRMKIGMDKYKTAELGRALKRVYRGEITVADSTRVAENEIAAVFAQAGSAGDDGFVGDRAGACPLCGGEVVRTKFGYGCSKWRDGCKFSVNGRILGVTIPLSAVRQLLTDGHTDVIDGFVSKKGSRFSARLKLAEGRAVFDFDGAPRVQFDPGIAPSAPPPGDEGGQLRPGVPVDDTF